MTSVGSLFDRCFIVYLTPPLGRLLLNYGTAFSFEKTRMMGPPGGETIPNLPIWHNTAAW